MLYLLISLIICISAAHFYYTGYREGCNSVEEHIYILETSVKFLAEEIDRLQSQLGEYEIDIDDQFLDEVENVLNEGVI